MTVTWTAQARRASFVAMVEWRVVAPFGRAPMTRSQTRAPSSRPSPWQGPLMKLMAQALHHVPRVRMAEISRRLIGGGEPVSPDEETVSLVQLFSANLALFTASPGRSSAVERLAKQLRLPPASVEGQALTGLLEARLALFELTGPAESTSVTGLESASCNATLAKFHQIGPHFLFDQQVRRPAAMGCQLADCVKVVELRSACQPTQNHVIDHPAAKRRHRLLKQLRHSDTPWISAGKSRPVHRNTPPARAMPQLGHPLGVAISSTELVTHIAEATGLSQDAATKALDATTGGISAALVRGARALPWSALVRSR